MSFIARTMKEYMDRFAEKKADDTREERRASLGGSSSSSSVSGIFHVRSSAQQPDKPKPGEDSEVVPLPDRFKEAEAELTDADYLLCEHKIQAFLLDRKRWITVLVTDLAEIDWYPEPWKALQLEQEKKDLIYGLVKGYKSGENVFAGFDDIVQGKGKGLIFLLHGKPGLGKTFTAGTHYS